MRKLVFQFDVPTCNRRLSGIGGRAQNVGEARQLVTLYQYLRLRGYPADKISVLTTYNGQKALLREEIDARCVANPAVREVYGRPHKVSPRMHVALLAHLVCGMPKAWHGEPSYACQAVPGMSTVHGLI